MPRTLAETIDALRDCPGMLSVDGGSSLYNPAVRVRSEDLDDAIEWVSERFNLVTYWHVANKAEDIIEFTF